MLKLFCPDWYCDSILSIDTAKLKATGVEGFIIDLDNTLLPRDERETSNEVKDWLRKTRRLGFRMCIVSNNRGERVKEVANELGLSVVTLAAKPYKGAFKQGLKILGTHREKTVVVGDQIFTDILGGNLAGLKTILVVPMSSKELFHTRVLRYFERIIIKKLMKRNQVGVNQACFN